MRLRLGAGACVVCMGVCGCVGVGVCAGVCGVRLFFFTFFLFSKSLKSKLSRSSGRSSQPPSSFSLSVKKN